MTYDNTQLIKLALAVHIGAIDLQAMDSDQELDDIVDQCTYDENQFTCDSEEYYIFSTFQEAEQEAKRQSSELLWAFNADFLAGETGLPPEAFQAIQDNGKCENNNEAIEAILDGTCGVEQVLQAAIDCDGVEHTLSSYDGNEVTLACKVTGQTFYAYRIN